MNKQIAIIGGGTISWVASHLALTAPAYGTTAKQISVLCGRHWPELDVRLHLTKMAGSDMACQVCGQQPSVLETNEDVSELVDQLVQDDLTKVVFFTAAMVDYKLEAGEGYDGDKHGARLSSRDNESIKLPCVSAEKIIPKVRKTRKDIFLVGFKQTSGATEDEQYIAGLELCKEASCNLVLANDVQTRVNMVVTPEEARYHITTDRIEALTGLVEMAKLRSHLSFTRSTVVAGQPVPWESEEVPASLRAVVDYCIAQNAYKPFRGSTVGHFAVKLNDNIFLTSQRKTNFNDLAKIGLVKVKTDGPDTVTAYGAKPSVGGQSQRLVFNDHPELDCIVHFHCPIRPGSEVPVRSQYEFECGSHECGKNTSDGLQQFGNLKAVHLDEQGPNIVFHHSIDPVEVIQFIENNFDLEKKTGGFVSVK